MTSSSSDKRSHSRGLRLCARCFFFWRVWVCGWFGQTGGEKSKEPLHVARMHTLAFCASFLPDGVHVEVAARVEGHALHLGAL